MFHFDLLTGSIFEYYLCLNVMFVTCTDCFLNIEFEDFAGVLMFVCLQDYPYPVNLVIQNLGLYYQILIGGAE